MKTRTSETTERESPVRKRKTEAYSQLKKRVDRLIGQVAREVDDLDLKESVMGKLFEVRKELDGRQK